MISFNPRLDLRDRYSRGPSSACFKTFELTSSRLSQRLASLPAERLRLSFQTVLCSEAVLQRGMSGGGATLAAVEGPATVPQERERSSGQAGTIASLAIAAARETANRPQSSAREGERGSSFRFSSASGEKNSVRSPRLLRGVRSLVSFSLATFLQCLMSSGLTSCSFARPTLARCLPRMCAQCLGTMFDEGPRPLMRLRCIEVVSREPIFGSHGVLARQTK